MVMQNKLIFGGLMVMLAGCANQAPAPVTSGYGQPATTQAYGDNAQQPFTTVEPAAGPVPQVEAGVPADVTRATLPTPSLLGDVARSFDVTAPAPKGWKSYQIQRGDTIYRLSRAFNASPEAILKANNLSSAGDLTEGKVVVIPAGIGRFAKADAVAGLMQKQAVPEVQPQVAEVVNEVPVADIAPAAGGNVVTGPSGTRYSLTRHRTEQVGSKQNPTQTAASKPMIVEENLASNVDSNMKNIEPAAGPVAKVVEAATAEDVQVTMHKVEAKETVYRIAQTYGASVLDIMNANDFDSPQDLKAGTMVKVPVAKGGKVALAQPMADEGVKGSNLKPSNVTEVKADLYRGKIDLVAARAKGFVWPVKGEVINHFGREGAGVSQTGINIKVPANSPVLAAESGQVVYADNALKTYGNLVLLRHSNGMVTAYAHNNALLVTKGEKVKKGQSIALSGNTGSVKDAQLHFEVRRAARAVDPMSVLPR